MSTNRGSICLVLGAGFSVPFGMPTTADLWSRCIEAAPGSTESAIEKAKLQYPLDTFIQRKIHDVELLLTVWMAHDAALEELRGHRLKVFGESDWDKWKENRLRLLDYLENLQCWVHHHSRGANRSPLAVGLMRFFKETTARDTSLRIVSFNYDIIVEQALQEADLDYRYFANGPSTKAKSKHSLVLIAKPHGSIHWVPETNEYRGPSATVQSKTSYLTRQIWQGTSDGINFWSWDRDLSRSFRKFRATNTLLHLPPIIPPAAGKQYGAFQLALFEEAFNHIASASSVAIVGYSFPDADQSAQQIIRRALANGGKKRVVYINPDNPSCKRAGELLGHVVPQIIEDRWSLNHLFDLF